MVKESRPGHDQCRKEIMAITTEQQNFLVSLYVGYFDRAPDPAGLQFWIDQVEDGRELNTIAQDFANSPEAKALYPFFTTPDVSTANAFVTSVYQNLFNRAPDTAGLTFWTGVIEAGTVSPGDMIDAIIQGATTDPDKTIIDNKVDVGLDYATKTANTPGFEFNDAAKTAAQDALDGVTDDPATVTAAKAATDTFVGEGGTANNPGETFTLTDSVGENVTGTGGNDTFKGVLDGGITAGDVGTINVGDEVDGGAGTDTFNVIVTDAAAGGAIPAGLGVSNMEIINLTYATDGDHLGALSSSSFGGVEQLWQIDNTNTTDDFQNVTVAAGVTAGFKSTGATATAAQVAGATTVTAASGTQKTIAVAFDGVDGAGAGSGATFVGAGLETATVSGNVAGTAGTMAMTGVANIETLNLGITDDTVVTLATFGGVTAVDASSSTGGFTANVSGLGALETYTGGTGGETITFDLEVGNDVTVDMGTGNDTAILAGTVAGANNASTITLGADSDTLDLNAISNIFDADEADFADGLITIADFSAVDDVLDTAGLTTARKATNTEQANIEAEANLFDAIGVASGLNAGSALVFGYGGDTYVFDDNDGSGTFNTGDGLVKLTGVSVDALDAAGTNFVPV
jgi:hypothetical protein